MRKSRFTEAQIMTILGEGEAGLPVAQVCRKHEISTATYYQWKRGPASRSLPTPYRAMAMLPIGEWPKSQPASTARAARVVCT